VFFFLSSITIGKASSLIGEDNGNIFAKPNLRGLQAICNDSGNDPSNSGDCSDTPTICGSNGNAVNCQCDNPPPPREPLPVETCYTSDNFRQHNCGGCRGTCSGNNNCLNLDFYCAEGQGCEMICTGQNSCKGVTLHCPDHQVCNLDCYGDSCVDAKVICGEGTVEKNDRRLGLGCELAVFNGGCSGENNCLKLDFYCAEGQDCEMNCAAQDSCEGVTLHCPDNQVCNLNCPGEGSCVDAEVRCGEGTVANSIEIPYFPFKIFSCTVPTIDPTNAPVSPVPDPTNAPVSPDPWNDDKETCNACGGFWPTTQPADCQKPPFGFPLTECGSSPTGCRDDADCFDGEVCDDRIRVCVKKILN